MSVIAKRKANNRKATGYPADGTPADAFCKPGYSYNGPAAAYGKAKLKRVPKRMGDDA